MPLPVLDVPTYERKLISTNKTIKYRPFLVKEHKVLLMLKDANSSEISRVVTDIIDNCTFHKLKMQDLAFFDIVHLFVELRKVSIGENLDLVINCECGTKIDTVADLNKVRIENKNAVNNNIQLNGTTSIQMHYPKLEESLEAYSTNDIDETLELITKCIDGIHHDNEFHDARDSTKQELQAFVDQLNTRQLEKIVEFFASMPRVVLDVVSDCPTCNKHHELKIKGLDNFFV